MKILFICNYSQLYGANRSLLTLIEEFHKNNYELLVLVPSKGPMSNELKKNGIPYATIRYYSAFLYFKPIIKHLAIPLLFIINLINFPKILFLTRNFNPDIIYSNTLAENIGIIVAKLLKVKHICHAREFMSLDHGSYFVLGSRLKRKYIKLSDGVIFVSRSVANFINNSTTLRDNQEVIFNGIKYDNIEFKEKSIPSYINFGIVGILQESKGHSKCIQHFALLSKKIPNSKLHIFGEGDRRYKNKLEKEILEAGLTSKVIFHGFVSNTSIIYNKIDILLMFSRSEGFGRVTAEALLHAIPVIGLDNAGTSELILHGQTGYLFSNYHQFETSILSLLKDDISFNHCRKQASMVSRKQFSIENYYSSVETFVKKIYSLNK